MIVGGGFGGLAAARKLRRADVDVTLVDRMNHHLFQPLLYQVAGGAVAPGECAATIRSSLGRSHNTAVLMAEVVDVDVEGREVVLDRGERLGYDSLIVACGAETAYFGNDEWANVSCGLKTLADAVDLRNRIYGAFEEAERAGRRGVPRGVADLCRHRGRAYGSGGRRSACDHGPPLEDEGLRREAARTTPE